MRNWRARIGCIVGGVAGLLFFGSYAGAADAPITLKYSSYLPPTHHVQVVHQWGADEIEKRTNGRVKIKMYHSEALHSAKKGFEALRSGISDISLAYPIYEPTGFNLALGGGLPFKFPNALIGVRIMEEIYPEFIKKEYEATGSMLAYWCVTNNYFLTALRKPVATLADLKGMKIRSGGGIHAEVLKALGAVPVMMPTTEIYASLERGVIDGCFISPASAMSYRLNEVGKHLTVLPIATTDVPVAMSPKTFKRLPKDIQDIVYRVFRECGMRLAQDYEQKTAKALEEWPKKGAQVTKTSVNDFKTPAVAAVDDKWLADCDKAGKGKQAKEMLQKMGALVIKYAKMPEQQLVKEHVESDRLK